MPSSIDYDSFLHWCESRFGAENIKIHKDEICTHSIFTDDKKYHLWMNPTGGKKQRENGVYRCWKTDKRGSLVSLVSQVDGIGFDEAEELICSSLSLRALEKKVDEFFGHYDVSKPENSTPIVLSQKYLNLPPYTFSFKELDETEKKKFKKYLDSRKLPPDNLLFCIDGDYYDRVIIPYYNEKGDVIWYNARSIYDSKNGLKYMKPKEKEFSQDDCLFFTSFPPVKTKIYVTEGELDAFTLKLCGYHAVACGGKTLSESQIEILRKYIPVLAFDNDEGKSKDWGLKSTIDIGNQLIEKGFEEIYFIRPSKGFKDWNEILVKLNKDVIKHYISKYEQRLTQVKIAQLFSTL